MHLYVVFEDEEWRCSGVIEAVFSCSFVDGMRVTVRIQLRGLIVRSSGGLLQCFRYPKSFMVSVRGIGGVVSLLKYRCKESQRGVR